MDNKKVLKNFFRITLPANFALESDVAPASNELQPIGSSTSYNATKLYQFQ